MRIDRQTGLLVEARQVPSPNRDDRPFGRDIDLVVIHGISLPPGHFGGPWIDALFTNTLDPNAHPFFAELNGLSVSSHLLIRRTGEIVQYVPFQHRAWHAGQSWFQGRAQCNDFSIGIELEGTDTVPYRAIQYSQLAQTIIALKQVYRAITPNRIVGHADIAPGRKTDPGPVFDWERLRRLLQSGYIEPPACTHQS
jgi:N-acetyl-anhydromuramoyl-L-alanine amidase